MPAWLREAVSSARSIIPRRISPRDAFSRFLLKTRHMWSHMPHGAFANFRQGRLLGTCALLMRQACGGWRIAICGQCTAWSQASLKLSNMQIMSRSSGMQKSTARCCRCGTYLRRLYHHCDRVQSTQLRVLPSPILMLHLFLPAVRRLSGAPAQLPISAIRMLSRRICTATGHLYELVPAKDKRW